MSLKDTERLNMDFKKASEMFREIMRKEIAALPCHYDEEAEGYVYDDIEKMNELVALNLFVLAGLAALELDVKKMPKEGDKND